MMRVVDHQHGIAAADQPIRLNKQFCLHRRHIPDPGGNEAVQSYSPSASRSAIGFDRRLSDAGTAEDGSAQESSLNESAKVLLVDTNQLAPHVHVD